MPALRPSGNSLCTTKGITNAMEKNLCSLDLNTLKALYEAEAAALEDALIAGARWEDTRSRRQTVTDLAIAIHERRTGRHPAADDLRRGRA